MPLQTFSDTAPFSPNPNAKGVKVVWGGVTGLAFSVLPPFALLSPDAVADFDFDVRPFVNANICQRQEATAEGEPSLPNIPLAVAQCPLDHLGARFVAEASCETPSGKPGFSKSTYSECNWYLLITRPTRWSCTLIACMAETPNQLQT